MLNKTVVGIVMGCALSLVCAEAQNFKPFTSLTVIQTERFDIIFPEESRRTAETLASFADATYDRVSALLGIRLSGRIPVTITPHTEAFNGYMNPFPYQHIVLFDTPMDIEWTTFRNSLEGLFLHELTHAVSLGTRSPFFDFLHGIFGGWIVPAGFTSPLFMAEGVTVSFESLEGFGRANDPEVKQGIRQAIHEGTFLTPFQASGIYDKPPLGNAYYEYGGLFSAYIQQRFGMEKYAELWRQMGARIPVSLNIEKHGFARIFKDVYDLPLRNAWDDFSEALAIRGLEANEGGKLSGGESLIDSMDSGGSFVFVLDRIALTVDAYNPATGERRRIVRTDGTADDIEVSEDGRRLIVAGYRYSGALASAVAVEYETVNGKRTGRSWNGIYRPRYFRDGIVGIAADLHENRLVYRDAVGAEHVLLAGSAERIFSAPAPLDDDRIAFIVSERGVRRIGIYDFRTTKAALLKSDLQDDAARWNYARDLRATEGKLFFSYDHDDRFYKLATIDFRRNDGPIAVFSRRDFSGGVFAPVAVADDVFYRGAFSTWDALMRYPEKAGELTGTEALISLEPWFDGDYVLTENEAAKPVGTDSEAVRASASTAFPERTYSGLRFLNPFNLWIPLPLLRQEDNSFRIDGGGIFSYLSTPTDMNTFFLFAGGDAAAQMGYFDMTWNSYSLGAPLAVKVSDGIEFVADQGFDAPYRATRASTQITFGRGAGGERLRLFLAPSAEAAWIAMEDEGEASAYGWSYDDGEYAIGVSLGLSSFERLPWRLFGRGFSAVTATRLALPSREPRYDGIFRIAAEPVLPFRATLYGAWDESGQDLDGYTGLFGDSIFGYAAPKEYVDEVGTGLRWVAGGELEFRVFSTEVQANLSHLYFNRLFALIAWRGAAYDADSASGTDLPGAMLMDDSKLVQSLVFKTGAVISAMPIAMVPFRLSPYLWAALKLSNMGDEDSGDELAFGIAIALEW